MLAGEIGEDMSEKIPNIFHFVFGLKPDFGGKPFSLVHYLSIQSAIEVNTPDKVYFHYHYEPTGYWWELIKPKLTLNLVSIPESIFGNPLHHFAHKADVIRLEVLLEYGGIYLDLDTICVRPLAPFYDKSSFMIGSQLNHESFSLRLKRSVRSLDLSSIMSGQMGLCNAVLLATKNNPFVKIWYDSYRYFRSKGRDEYWHEHSVIVPHQLATTYKSLVTIASPYRFHYPIYDENGLKNLFEHTRSYPDAYVHHLWETLSWDRYLQHLTPEGISTVDTTYNLIARQHLSMPRQG
jgi:hypothetical protein